MATSRNIIDSSLDEAEKKLSMSLDEIIKQEREKKKMMKIIPEKPNTGNMKVADSATAKAKSKRFEQLAKKRGLANAPSPATKKVDPNVKKMQHLASMRLQAVMKSEKTKRKGPKNMQSDNSRDVHEKLKLPQKGPGKNTKSSGNSSFQQAGRNKNKGKQNLMQMQTPQNQKNEPNGINPKKGNLFGPSHFEMPSKNQPVFTGKHTFTAKGSTGKVARRSPKGKNNIRNEQPNLHNARSYNNTGKRVIATQQRLHQRRNAQIDSRRGLNRPPNTPRDQGFQSKHFQYSRGKGGAIPPKKGRARTSLKSTSNAKMQPIKGRSKRRR